MLKVWNFAKQSAWKLAVLAAALTAFIVLLPVSAQAETYVVLVDGWFSAANRSIAEGTKLISPSAFSKC